MELAYTVVDHSVSATKKENKVGDYSGEATFRTLILCSVTVTYMKRH